ncbi:MAG: hypothetical protein GC205_01860 [Bacteroidetes bacterium]|nr:hypothetical protein [Bacteroidota bacterium]
MKKWIFLSLAALISTAVLASDDWSDNLNETDREALDALVLYPADVRQSILIAGTKPELLVRLDRLQKESQGNFEAALQSLNQQDQEAIWELTRYSGLLETMTRSGSPSAAELQRIAAGYEEALRPSILDQGQRNFNVLVAVQRTQKQAEQGYTDLLAPYSGEVRGAFNQLIGMPEVLEILSSHLNLTVLVSDLYSRDPAGVSAHLDALAIEAAARQKEALADWQAQLESDPQMRTELESAAAMYAEEQGWTDDEYTLPPQESTTRVEVRYVYEPYPYWFGYPYWRPYRSWYPYPWWYDWGFYYGPRGSLVVFGMPTYTFWGWYYGNPYRHYYYPHLTNGCVAYYNNHRRTGVSLNGPTRDFIKRSEGIAGKNWLDEQDGRVNKIRDFGKLEMDYAAQSAGVDRQKTRTELLRENPKKYPTIQAPNAQTADPDRPSVRPTPTRPEATRPSAKPSTDPADPARNPTERPAPAPDKPAPTAPRPSKPEARPSPQPVAPDRMIERPQTEPSRMTRPEDLHKGTWSRPEPSRAAPAPSRPSPSRATPAPSAPRGGVSSPPRSSSKTTPRSSISVQSQSSSRSSAVNRSTGRTGATNTTRSGGSRP